MRGPTLLDNRCSQSFGGNLRGTRLLASMNTEQLSTLPGTPILLAEGQTSVYFVQLEGSGEV